VRAGSVVAWSPWVTAGRDLSGVPVMVSCAEMRNGRRGSFFKKSQTSISGGKTSFLSRMRPCAVVHLDRHKLPLLKSAFETWSHFAAI